MLSRFREMLGASFSYYRRIETQNNSRRLDGYLIEFIFQNFVICADLKNFVPMDFELIEVEKSIEDRYEEYTNIFNLYGYDEADDFSKMWSAYLIASTMETTGWLALWKLSKASCFDHGVNFGSSFLVMVDQVDYTSLSAEVELCHEEDSKRYNLPRKLSVPLVDLYILKEQDSSILFATGTAECLDQLRIFYKFLWWPWDAYSRESTNWFCTHLQRRLKLYNDIKLWNYPEPIVKYITTLIEKGKLFLHDYLEESDSFPPDDESDLESQKKIMKSFGNLELIKISLRMFLSDDRWKTSLFRGMKENKLNPEAFLAVKEFDLKNILPYTHEIATSYPTTKLRKIEKDLEVVLDHYENNDIIFLSPEEHLLDYGCLNANVTLRNSTAETSTIKGNSSYRYLLKTTADNICLQNLLVVSEKNLVIVYIKEGVTLMDSITMMGSASKRQKAIVVGRNATLVASKCKFVGFSSAIVCLSGSAVQLTDCVFQNNSVAIEAIGDAQLCLTNVTASQSKRVFIKYEGDTPSDVLKPMKELSNIPSINLDSVKVDNEDFAVEFV